jgi:hypothetical protein
MNVSRTRTADVQNRTANECSSVLTVIPGLLLERQQQCILPPFINSPENNLRR